MTTHLFNSKGGVKRLLTPNARWVFKVWEKKWNYVEDVLKMFLNTFHKGFYFSILLLQFQRKSLSIA